MLIIAVVSYYCVSSWVISQLTLQLQNLMTQYMCVCVCVQYQLSKRLRTCLNINHVYFCVFLQYFWKIRTLKIPTYDPPDTCWAPPVNPYLSTCTSPGMALPFAPGSEPPVPLSVSLSTLPRNSTPLPYFVFAIDSTFSSAEAAGPSVRTYRHQHVCKVSCQTSKPPMKTHAGWLTNCNS